MDKDGKLHLLRLSLEDGQAYEFRLAQAHQARQPRPFQEAAQPRAAAVAGFVHYLHRRGRHTGTPGCTVPFLRPEEARIPPARWRHARLS
jgi:hypothetical protein